MSLQIPPLISTITYPLTASRCLSAVMYDHKPYYNDILSKCDYCSTFTYFNNEYNECKFCGAPLKLIKND